MNGEVVDSCTPVRRSARTRKPNSRFAADELDGCIRKIVTGVEASKSEVKKTDTPPITASPVGRKRGRKKDGKSEDEQSISDREKDGKKAEDDKEVKDDLRLTSEVETKINKKAKHSGAQDRDSQTKGEGEKSEDRGSHSGRGSVAMEEEEEEDKDKTCGKDNESSARKLRKGRSSRRTSENETAQVQEAPVQEPVRKKTKEEVERMWKEETERLKRKMEEEMRLKKEEEDEKRRRRQEEEKRKKKAEEDKRKKLLEAMKKEEEERKKEEENRKRKEEEEKKKKEEENRKKEEENRKRKEEENRMRKEEENRKRKEEETKKKKEEEIRRKKEEELVKKRKEEEENKKRIQEENKKKKEENRKKKEEESRRRKEEEENRKRKEEEENRKRKEEEENRKRKEEEENRKRKEEEENRKRKEEEEKRKIKEEEEKRKRKEEEENKKRKEEEENRKRREEEERQKKSEEENRMKMEEEKMKEEASRKNKEEEDRKKKEEENRESREEETRKRKEEERKMNKEEESKKRIEEKVNVTEEQVKKKNEEQSKRRKEEDDRISGEEEKNEGSEEEKKRGGPMRRSEDSKRKFELEENQKEMSGKDKRKKEEDSNDGEEERKNKELLTQGNLKNEAKNEKVQELDHSRVKGKEASLKKDEKESSSPVIKRKREQDKADDESAPSPRRTRQSSKDDVRKLEEAMVCSTSDSSVATKTSMASNQEGASGSHTEGDAKVPLISAKDVNSSADLSKPCDSVNAALSNLLSEENNGKGQTSSLSHSFMNGDIQHSFNKYGDDFIPGLGEDAAVSLLASDSFHKDRDKCSDGKEFSKHKNSPEREIDFSMKGKRLSEQWKGEGNNSNKEVVEGNLHQKGDKKQDSVIHNLDSDVTSKVASTGIKPNVICVNSKESGKEGNGEIGTHLQVGKSDGKSSSSTRVRKSRWNTVQTSASDWKGVDSVKAVNLSCNQGEVKRSVNLTTNAEESTVNKRASLEGIEERPSKRNRSQDVKSMCIESIGDNKFKRNQKESDSKESLQVVKLAVKDTESSVIIKEGNVSSVKNETEQSATLPAAPSNQDGESGIMANKHLSQCDIKKEEDSHGSKVDEFGGSGKELKMELGVVENKENVIPKCEEPGGSEMDSDEKVKYSEDGKQKKQESEDEKIMQSEKEEIERRNRDVVEKRLKSFVHLEDNVYVTEKRRSKRSKEVRRMVCDCTLTKEEVVRGDKGCGEDCLNRLLMIECGSRCPLRDQCMNKRFQQHGYAKVEVFNAEEKGCGVRTMEPLVPGTFIMEYVGEVFDTKEFKRRKKEYAREKNAHFYFMALKSDELIDATRKGNISRFINHSCDPNAETQKWTVNGDLRIGFFATKSVEAGEEITFDYRLERYGREPQKCYCGAANCRGWLGESPDEKTKEEKDEERRKEERDKRKRDERRSYFEDMDLEEEIEKLNSHHLRNRQDTLTLSRLMVRAEDFDSRVALLRLLQMGEQACRRLFLDYHGLRLLWSWMVDQTSSLEHITLKLEILKTLECLPVTNKTQLTDSRVLGLVEKWSTQVPDNVTSASLPPPPPPASTVAPQYPDDPMGKKISENSEDSSDTETDKGMNNAMDSPAVDDSSSLDSQEATPKHSEESSDSNLSFPTATKELSKEEGEEQNSAKKLKTEEQDAKKVKEGGVEEELLQLQKQVMDMSLKLLESWKHLKEAFRIPKKERIELMKEHEREVDRGYKEYLDKQRDRDRDRDRDRRDRDRYVRYYERRRRSPDRDRDRDRYRRNGRNDRERENREDRATDSPKLSKEERRQLFALKVQQEEEEAKQRKMQEEMWTLHVDRCRMLGQDPYLTPIFDPSYQYYWDPVSSSWQPYTGPDPSIPVPAGYGKKADGDISEGSPLAPLPQGQVVPGQAGHLGILGQGVVLPGQSVPGIPGVKVSDVEVTLPGLKDDDPLDPASIPLPGEVSTAPSQTSSPSQAPPDQAVPVEGTPPQGAKVIPVQWCSVDGAGKPPTLPLPAEGNPPHALLDPSNPLTLPLVLAEDRVAKCPPPGPITVQLPPKWKMARDSEGHVYFYHIKTRRSQWEPPTWEQHQQIEAELGSDSDSDLESSDDSDSSSSSDSEEFSSDEEEEEEKVEQSEEVPEEKMIKRPPSHKKKRSEALVQERVISPILEIDREAARRERREAKERAREEARQERREERRTQATTVKEPVKEPKPVTKEEKIKSKERAATAIADNSELARKIKDNFRSKMATYIVSVLNPYRKSDCKKGRITSTEDFKYLARKLTHFVMVKELKQLKSIESLDCSDSVKHKTRDFVRKYMGKYGSTFKRDPNDTKEY